MPHTSSLSPLFADFAPPIRDQSDLRRAITAAYRRPEAECLAPLLDQATLDDATAADATRTATSLITALRAKSAAAGSRGSSRNMRCRARRASR